MTEKTFSVINVYRRLGIVKGDFDKETERFRKRPIFYFRAFLSLFLIITVPLKLNICLLFDEDDPIQFYIGDWFNGQMDSESRFWMARNSLAIAISLFILHLALSDLNQDVPLLLLTMKKLYILPPKDEEHHQYVGLSKTKTKKFWKEENDFNLKLDKLLNVCSIGSGLLLSTFNFNTKFDIGLYDYLVFATLHSLHNSLYVNVALSEFGNSNIFTISVFKFFRKRYEAVRLKIEKALGKRVNNRKLKRMLNDFNYITMELGQINKYWSRYVGWYFLTILVSCVVFGYLVFEVDFMIKIVISYALVSVLFFVILLPYYQSQKILIEMRKITRKLQNASFRIETSLENRKQINYISFITRDESVCFTCFDLFVLNTYNSFLVRIVCWWACSDDFQKLIFLFFHFQIITNLITYVIMVLKVSSS